VQQHHKVNRALRTYNHYKSLLCCTNNYALLLCHAPKSTVQSLGSCTITCCMHFLYHALIFCVHFTLHVAPCQSLVCPYRAPLVNVHHKLNCRATTCTHIACAATKILCDVPILCTPCATLLCVCTLYTPYYAYAHHAMLNLACALAHQQFCTWRQNLAHALAHQHFSRVVLKFSARTRTLTFFLRGAKI
jgi:hypothetical protein